MDPLLEPITIGAIGTLRNRMIMAPLTRCRTDPNTDHVPSDLMAEYYAQRASAGLIIAEATMAMADHSSFWREPGIYSQAQVAGWKKVTDAVHSKGGKIILQICHPGRAAHPLNSRDGKTAPMAPSALRIDSQQVRPQFNPTGEAIDFVMPREMTADDIKETVKSFALSANNAMAAGFDGVEIHSANGYLLDQFLRTGSNTRTDEYGGSVENRGRLLMEVVDAVGKAIGYDRTGVRISPLNSTQSMMDEDPFGLTTYIAEQLSSRKIAFLHLMRGDFFAKQTGDVVTPGRKHFQGVYILNQGFQPTEAAEALGQGKADAVAFGALFIGNPDLVERIAAGAELTVADTTTYFTKEAKGYTDYPCMPSAV